MAKDVNDLGDVIGSAVGKIAREAAHSITQDGHGSGLRGRRDSALSNVLGGGSSNGALSGMRGVAAGAALAAAAPLAAKGAGKVVKRATGRLGDAAGKSLKSPTDMAQKAAEGVKGGVGEAVGKVGEVASGGDDKQGAAGVGKGRRMPVQQSFDIGVPLSVAYNQWTQFEEWPQFMHRLDQATQEDETTVSFKTKIWGMSKEFVAQIVEQRPDERIQWEVKQGVTHTGVVTFHELAPRLTRVQVTLDIEPGSLIEKAARGMRHVKRAVRGDMARFKAFIEMSEEETGAWRGEIHDGEVVSKPESKGGGQSRAASSGARGGSARQRSSSARKRGGGGSRGGGNSSRKRGGSTRKRSSGGTRKSSGARA